MENPGPGCHDASQGGGGYDSAGTEYVDEIPQICAGQEYCFEITDSWGDGICCSWGDGSYLLELDDGTAVASGGTFGRSEKTCFTAPLPLPAPVPTARPTTTTGPPQAQPTLHPTDEPMSCDEAGCPHGCLKFDTSGPVWKSNFGRPRHRRDVVP